MDLPPHQEEKLDTAPSEVEKEPVAPVKREHAPTFKTKKKKSFAHEYSLDIPHLASIEFPLRVKNVDKAVDMVGGKEEIARSFLEQDSKLTLNLRPDDPYSHAINSSFLDSDNILAKISIPKKILEKNNRDIQKSINECKEKNIKYKFEPYALLDRNYRFRKLADFQLLTRESKFTNQYLNSIHSGNVQNIKQMSDLILTDRTVENLENKDYDIPPLLKYAGVDIPFQYDFTRNPFSTYVDEDGNLKAVAKRKRVILHTIFIEWDQEPPTTFDPELKPLLEKAEKDCKELKENGLERIMMESSSYYLLECIKLLKVLFRLKPIWIRRHLYWMIPHQFGAILRFALPYVAYSVKKGPWRQSYIKFGYNPTKDPGAMIYQAEAFRNQISSALDNDIQQLIDKNRETLILPRTLIKYEKDFDDPNSEINKLSISKLPKQLIYDGASISSAVSYQIGDLDDPDIISLLSNPTLKTVCTEKTGWLDGVVLSRIRLLMKYKLDCIAKGLSIEDKVVRDICRRTHFKTSEAKTRSESDEEGDGNDNDRDIDDADDVVEADDVDDNEHGEEEETLVEDTLDEDITMADADESVSVPVTASTETDIVKNASNQMDLLTRLKLFNPKGEDLVEHLDGLLRQDNVMDFFPKRTEN